MFEAPPELSPDLDWILQSNQTSQELLIEKLLTEAGEHLYSVAVAILDDQEAAKEALSRTLVRVIQMRHRFWGEMTAIAWLVAQVVQTCWRLQARVEFQQGIHALMLRTKVVGQVPQDTQEAELWLAISKLSYQQRIPMILRYRFDYSPAEVATIMDIPTLDVERRLAYGLRRLGKALRKAGYQDELTAEQLTASLGRRWPAVRAFESNSQVLEEQLRRDLDNHTTIRHWTGLVQQGALILAVVGLLGAIGWLTNRLAGARTPNPLISKTIIITQFVEVSVHVTATPRVTPTLAPLTDSSPVDEILARMADSWSSWKTLWLEGINVQYGPAEYIGEPVIRREQVWVSQPYNSLVLNGPADGEVDQVWFALNGKVYDLDFPSGKPVLYDFHGDTLPVYSVFAEMIFPFIPDGSQGLTDRIKVVGSGQVAERPTIVLAYTPLAGNPSRLWVDVESGMILGLRRYGEDGKTVIQDIVMIKLEINPAIPAQIYDRQALLTKFVQNAQGDELPPGRWPIVDYIQTSHTPHPRISPPADFAATNSQIRFQWSAPPQELFAYHSNITWQGAELASSNPPPLVDLFADDYYLGTLSVGNPWRLTCERSPDGSKLAFIELPENSELTTQTSIRWVDLSAPQEISALYTGEITMGTDVAFTADGAWMAYWGCEGRNADCSVYLLDTTTGVRQALLTSGYVSSLVWSPTGEELAMLTANQYLLVVRVVDGEVIYRGEVDWETKRPPADAPVNAWDVKFPSTQSGLENCTYPSPVPGEG